MNYKYMGYLCFALGAVAYILIMYAYLKARKEEKEALIDLVDTAIVAGKELAFENARLREALELIAMSKRPDGTYNRSREACEQLAREALEGK